MGQIIICYKFDDLPLSKRNQFKRKLFGSKEKTHCGRYTAVTKGYLTNKKYEKPVRSVIVTQERYKEPLIKILREFDAKIWVFKVQESQ